MPIDEGKTVDVLKKAIKNETHQLKDVEVMHMQLFLAKKKRKKPPPPPKKKKKKAKKRRRCGAWLDEDEAAAVSRDELGRPESFEQMKEDDSVSHERQVLRADFQPGEGQVHVLVVVPDRHPAGCITKQLQFKRMSTAASCRKFLDAVATKPANLYDFHCSFGVPTIGDAFHAVDECKWWFCSVNCKQLTDKPLPGTSTKVSGKCFGSSIRAQINVSMMERYLFGSQVVLNRASHCY
ncbi:hypothetical protein Pcac1_g3848 [Phytophthora cactorum]|nr:hypothetical protein Pcac1_g3848 [Phytophthora cactorum]